MNRHRLLVLTSHPIQYQAPLFRALAARPEIELEVCFYSRWGIERHVDPQFGVPVAWDIPLLEGYRHRFLKNFGLDDGPKRFWSLINPAAAGLVLSNRFDTVWIQGWALASNWLAWAASALIRKPLLLRGESNGLEESGGWKRLAKRTILRGFFAKVSAFLTIGSLNREFYARYGVAGERLFPAPYAVDNAFFTGQADELAAKKRSLRAEYGIDPELPVVLFTGKLIPKKRPLDIIRAFEDAQRSAPCSLALVGDGALRQALENYVAQRGIRRVHFLGFRNQSEIGKLYALADVFVLPSSSEPWGLSVNEAMCFGLPVITSDQVGSSFDLIQPRVNGHVYPCGEVAALSLYIQQTLECEERRREMAAASRHLIERWNIERTVEGIVQAVSSTVAFRDGRVQASEVI